MRGYQKSNGQLRYQFDPNSLLQTKLLCKHRKTPKELGWVFPTVQAVVACMTILASQPIVTVTFENVLILNTVRVKDNTVDVKGKSSFSIKF